MGTAIVLLREVVLAGGVRLGVGSGGLVMRAPVDTQHAYRVKFAGGEEASVAREDVEVLAVYTAPTYQGTHDVLARHDLQSCVVLRCVVGSRAYGLEHEASDIDRRGVYVPRASAHWSLFGVPEQLEHDATQECYWELGKFVQLALKANPNVLEVLHSPLVELAVDVGAELVRHRRIFLSKLIHQTFSGYAMSQFRKLEQDLRTRGQLKWKHAMHLVRLLHAGAVALETGELPVRVQEYRGELLAIRDGLMAWSDVEKLREDLQKRFDSAMLTTQLPDRPDYDKANELLIGARLAAARKEFA